MKKKQLLTKLTPEQEAQIPVWIKKYSDPVFKGDYYKNFKFENAEKLIDWQYKKAGFDKPVVLIARSPYEAQLMFNFIKNYYPLNIIKAIFDSKNGRTPEISSVVEPETVESDKLYSQLYSQLDSQLYSQLCSQLDSQLCSQLDSQLYSQLCSQLRSQLDSQLYSQLYSQLRSQLRSQLDSQLYSQLDSQLYSQLCSQLYSQLDSQLCSQLYSQLCSQLDSQLYSQLYSQLDSQLYSQLDSQGDKKMYEYNSTYLFTSDIYSNVLLAWWDYMFSILKLDADIHEDFIEWRDLFVNSGVYQGIYSQMVCIISKYPVAIHRNSSGLLHNPNGSAVEWEDSWQNHFINGRSLPEWIWQKAANNEITKEIFIKETNSDIKGGIYEVLGQQKMMELLGAKEIDTRSIVHKNGDIETITLLKTKEKFAEIDNQPFAWVKMTCPSTGTQYLQGVEPHHKNALDAIASLSMFTSEEYSFTHRS